tara:strand:+ start:786 stop:905 length:120 start_codon:yes stop_codon:yes gene_type:complete
MPPLITLMAMTEQLTRGVVEVAGVEHRLPTGTVVLAVLV